MIVRACSLLVLVVGCSPSSGRVLGGAGGDTGSSEHLQDLALHPVPANVLACRVTWTTDQPASSEVRFGADGHHQLVVRDDALVTDHDVLVIGMRPETVYDLVASSTVDGEQTQSEIVQFESGAPPPPIAAARVDVYDRDLAEPGWTLVDLRDGDAWPATAVMFDLEGYPVWYHQVEEGWDSDAVDVRLTADGNVLIGGSIPSNTRPRLVDLAGNILWEGPLQTTTGSQGYLHHHIEQLDNGNMLLLRKSFRHGTRSDYLEEQTLDGGTVWTWDLFDGLEPDFDVDEWTHVNWAAADDGVAWVNDQKGDAIHKIDRATGQVAWTLHQGDGFQLVEGRWFRNQHAPSWLEDGNLLIYDNAGGEGETSRVVEYEVDEDAMTIRQVWQYPQDPDDAWYTEAWGDADRLPGGNTLIDAGFENRIFEVTADGEVAWDITLQTGSGRRGSYRAQRVPLLVDAL